MRARHPRSASPNFTTCASGCRYAATASPSLRGCLSTTRSRTTRSALTHRCATPPNCLPARRLPSTSASTSSSRNLRTCRRRCTSRGPSSVALRPPWHCSPSGPHGLCSGRCCCLLHLVHGRRHRRYQPRPRRRSYLPGHGTGTARAPAAFSPPDASRDDRAPPPGSLLQL
jgi:hypothetical protein